MKSQDILILLKIIALEDKPWFHHTLAEDLDISQSEVTQSLNRSRYAQLIDQERRKVNRKALYDFLCYGISYVFPQHPGEIVRGFATAHSAPPLKAMIESTENYVWPSAKGNIRGQSVLPIYKSVVKAVQTDTVLYELLALIDAIRVGKVREKEIALAELKKRIC
ncbi:MAG: hypothetical protein KF845_07865 [Cyclobacteriaceae bacterium]|nr:hypothetical protein [Cyclobacteriaceae bacterium]